MQFVVALIGLAIIGLFAALKFVIQPIRKKPFSWKALFAGITTGLVVLILSGSFFYAEPGYSYLVQYPTGTQVSVLTPGYHFYWYGTVLDFKKVVTIRLTNEEDEDSESATVSDNSVNVRFNDAVKAHVSSSTRFRMPEDPDLFKKLAVDYRTLNNLVRSSLVPVTKEVIRNSARELSAQDYVTGQGGQFEQNVLDQLEQGIVILRIEDELIPIKRVNADVPRSVQPEVDSDTSEMDTDAEVLTAIVQVDSDRGIKQSSRISRRVIRETNTDGSLKRKKHPLVQYGIQVTQSTIEAVVPEKKFQEMLAHQRDAAARSAVARQEAKQAEYEKQKVIARGETEKARVKMEQEKNQVEKLVSAETDKKEEEIKLDQARVNKQRVEVEAKALLTMATAEANAQRAKMLADGALAQKLSTYETIHKAYAAAFAKHQMVPSVLIGGGGNEDSNSATQLMNLLMASTAKDLSLNIGTK